MSSRLRLVSSIAIIMLAFAYFATKTYAEDNAYNYCLLTDGIHNKAYFSEVFFGKRGDTKFAIAFTDYVHGNYANVIGTSVCFWNNERPDARRERDEKKAQWRGLKNEIIDTSWIY